MCKGAVCMYVCVCSYVYMRMCEKLFRVGKLCIHNSLSGVLMYLCTIYMSVLYQGGGSLRDLITWAYRSNKVSHNN